MNTKYAIATVNRQGFTKYIAPDGAWTNHASEAAVFEDYSEAADHMVAEGLGHSSRVIEIETR